MNQWTVLDSLRQITSLDDRGAVSKALPLCEAAANQIMRRIKHSADPEDPRLSRAAAAVAYYDLVLLLSSDEDGTTSFKAGDVTVSRSTSVMLERASLIKNEALIEALPLFRDDSFIFAAV
ncbi:MAG: hypothetical protein IJB86_05435 [Clostridia bacterium]|nr:hypothetical protein [Clostridia bacterium]